MSDLHAAFDDYRERAYMHGANVSFADFRAGYLAASKAQTVDVEAICEVIEELVRLSKAISPEPNIANLLADKLAAALPKDQ